jgi:hypothetical protein
VAIAGNTALVGSAVQNPQAAHVFARQGSTWVREARLDVPVGQLAVALSATGARAVVGISGAIQSPVEAVHVFARRSSSRWVQEAILGPDTGHGSTTNFGFSVAISGDLLVVGASAEDNLLGAAYVFVRDRAGVWRRQARLTPAAQPGETPEFGWAVAVSGQTVVIGAFGEKLFRGTAYVFGRNRAGNWTQQARLAPADTTAGFQCFGVSVAVTFDGALITQPCDGQRGGVATHVYAFSRDSNGGWTRRAAVVSPAGADTFNFGFSVATDGLAALIGSPAEPGGGVTYALDCLRCLLQRQQADTLDRRGNDVR